MLQAIDERLSIWGWETGTGTRFAIMVDAWGRGGERSTGTDASGSRRAVADGDVRGVSFEATISNGSNGY